MTKTCSCGAHFSLHVELAVHRQKTGHSQYELPQVQPPLPERRKPKSHWKRTLVAGATVLSFFGLTAGLSATIRSYTSWSGTANVLLLP